MRSDVATCRHHVQTPSHCYCIIDLSKPIQYDTILRSVTLAIVVYDKQSEARASGMNIPLCNRNLTIYYNRAEFTSPSMQLRQGTI